MKKIIKYIFLFSLLFCFSFFLLKANISADDALVEMLDGASIRTDDNYALLFKGRKNGGDEYTYGFFYAKGVYNRDELIELNEKKNIEQIKMDKDGIFSASVKLSIDEIEQKITCIAYAKIDGIYIYSSAIACRSIMDVANLLGKGYATYVDNIINLAGEYKIAKVTFNANNGRFEETGSSDNLVKELRNPCDFPIVERENFVFVGWRNLEENRIYSTYPGTKKDNSEITYVAIWENAADANELLLKYFSDELTDKNIVPLEYDGKPLKWSVSDNDILKYSNGVFSYDALKRDHFDHDVTINLDFDGKRATKSYRIKALEFNDLSNKSPFAMYFSIGSLANFTNYKDNKIEKVFSDKVKEEIDIIYYAFANIDSNANVYVNTSSYQVIYKQLMELRQTGTRIVLCVSGVSGEACRNFRNICGSSSLRKVFVANLVNVMIEQNFDGIDIDWESAAEDNLVVASYMNDLMKDLRAALDAKSSKNKYLLTCAIPSTSWGAQASRFDLKTLNKYVDYVNMMSYDLNDSEKSTHVSALYSSSNDKGYGFGAVYGVTLFTNLGLEKKKIIIGTAAYGKAYKVKGTSSNAKYPGLGVSASLIQVQGVSGSFASGTIYYNGVMELKNNPNFVEYTEYNNSNQYVGTYLYSETDQIFVAFEGEEMIKQKAIYAKNNGLGIMIWSYFEDASGNLVETIANNIRK